MIPAKIICQDVQTEEHTHQMEGMPLKKKKKELKVTRAFYDKYTGAYLGDDPKKVLASLPPERHDLIKVLLLEALTGRPHKLK